MNCNKRLMIFSVDFLELCPPTGFVPLDDKELAFVETQSFSQINDLFLGFSYLILEE